MVSRTAIAKENKSVSPNFIPGGAAATHDVFGIPQLDESDQ